MPKTGTTAIQEFLHINSEILKNNTSILYPITGRLIGNSKLANNHYRLLDGFKNDQNYRNLTTIKQEAQNYSTVILSSEVITEKLHLPYIQKGLLQLNEVFSDYKIKIIIYLRNWGSYLNSIYNQAVKVSIFGLIATESIRDFLIRCEKTIGWKPENYLKYIYILENIFVNASIEIRSFEKKALKNGNLIYDFCDFLNINDLKNFKIPGYLNESLTVKQMRVLVLLNNSSYCIKNKPLLVNRLKILFPENDIKYDPYCLLTKNERIDIFKKNQNDQAKLRSYMRDPNLFLFDFNEEVEDQQEQSIVFNCEDVMKFNILLSELNK